MGFEFDSETKLTTIAIITPLAATIRTAINPIHGQTTGSFLTGPVLVAASTFGVKVVAVFSGSKISVGETPSSCNRSERARFAKSKALPGR